MLQGLQYLHSKGVEHRDVKPDNILLGANSVLKYVDFGAAKVIIKGNRTMAKTRAIRGGTGGDAGPAVMNSLAGTPMYLAPEVIKGGAGALGAADIWSMGCVVLEITTGRKPWSNLDNEWAIMFHIGIATQHPPLPDPGQMSDLGIDFIQQCLTIDPNSRPTASELMHHPWLSLMMELTMQPEQSPIASSVPSLLTTTNSDFQSLDSATTFDLTPQSERLPSGELLQPSQFSSEAPSARHSPENSLNNVHVSAPTEGTDSPLKTHMEEIAPESQPLVHPQHEALAQQVPPPMPCTNGIDTRLEPPPVDLAAELSATATPMPCPTPVMQRTEHAPES